MLVTPLLTETFTANDNAIGMDAWSSNTPSDTSEVPANTLVGFVLEYNQYLLFVLWLMLAMIYWGFFNQKKHENSTQGNQPNSARVMVLIHEGLIREVDELNEAYKKVQSTLANLDLQAAENFRALEDKLKNLDREYDLLIEQGESLKAERNEMLDDVIGELKEYKSYYLTFLSESPNALVFRPSWPTILDLKKYYQLKNYSYEI